MPYSKGKPYSRSRTHRFISQKLDNAFGDASMFIHRVVLSGLYGPVPEELENEEPVIRYNFQLRHHDRNQIELVADRISGFLDQYGDRYDVCLGYATSRAYREVLEQAAEKGEHLKVLPEGPKSRRLSEFFRHQNVEELIEAINTVLDKESTSAED